LPRAIIAGAGIAGLTAGLALLQAGLRVAIYERARTLEEFGAGLQLTPNATRVLSRLGVLEPVQRFALKPRAVLILHGSDDSELTRMSLADAEHHWGAPYLVIHRADLQRVLADAVRSQSGAELTLGATVVDFADVGGSVSVGLIRGLTEARDDGDLLVGADGLRSKVRDGLGFGAQNEADFTGRVAYRAVVNADNANFHRTQDDIILRLGKGGHLVQYPLRGGSIINLVATVSSPEPRGNAAHQEDGAAIRSILERAFTGWSRQARSLTDARTEWRAWPLYCRPPIPSFSLGRVALVGDAAHPMAPFLAQGAAQAIEDAGMLGRVLAKGQDIPAAVSMYSHERVARAARVQREALKLARIYHMNGPMALARNMTMRMLGPRSLIERYNWLYGT
jgi:2-polyprenyl-6-methoxyphenol hydroxylase-like FAD-dependent oxidoreductase